MRSRFIVYAVALAYLLCFTAASLAASNASLGAQTHAVVAVTPDLPLFETEAAAQKHCPYDTVVWLNTNSGIYHLKGERWYGRTKYGAYVCKKEADAAGDRETENGQ